MTPSPPATFPKYLRGKGQTQGGHGRAYRVGPPSCTVTRRPAPRLQAGLSLEQAGARDPVICLLVDIQNRDLDLPVGRFCAVAVSDGVPKTVGDGLEAIFRAVAEADRAGSSLGRHSWAGSSQFWPSAGCRFLVVEKEFAFSRFTVELEGQGVAFGVCPAQGHQAADNALVEAEGSIGANRRLIDQADAAQGVIPADFVHLTGGAGGASVAAGGQAPAIEASIRRIATALNAAHRGAAADAGVADGSGRAGRTAGAAVGGVLLQINTEPATDVLASRADTRAVLADTATGAGGARGPGPAALLGAGSGPAGATRTAPRAGSGLAGAGALLAGFARGTALVA